jgi:TolB protein
MNKTIFVIVLTLSVMTSGCSSIFPCPKEIIPPLRGTELGPAVLSPDGETIVFSVLTKSDSRLYKVRIDGTGFVPITSGQARAYDPVFSSDGAKILFSEVSDDNGDICEIKIDGSGRTCLTSGRDHDYNPVYSADGSKIYFLRASIFTNYSPIARPAWHNVDIYSMSADGKNITRITSERNYGMSTLSISPQGEALAVMGSSSGDPLWMLSLNDPANKKVILPDLDKYRKKTFFPGDKGIDYSSFRNPQFSPDGTKILFTVLNDELYVMDRKTEVAERIWKWESREKRSPSRMYPRYSHDGQRIVFSTATSIEINRRCDSDVTWKDTFVNTREMPKLWIVNSDGTGLMSVDVKPVE